MTLRDRLRPHKEDIRTVLELAEAFVCVMTPGAMAMLVWAQNPERDTLAVALFGAAIATGTSFRLWVKRSPLTRRLGVEHTSMDLPEVRDE